MALLNYYCHKHANNSPSTLFFQWYKYDQTNNTLPGPGISGSNFISEPRQLKQQRSHTSWRIRLDSRRGGGGRIIHKLTRQSFAFTKNTHTEGQLNREERSQSQTTNAIMDCHYALFVLLLVLLPRNTFLLGNVSLFPSHNGSFMEDQVRYRHPRCRRRHFMNNEFA